MHNGGGLKTREVLEMSDKSKGNIMKAEAILVSAVLILGLCAIASATVLHVPSEYPAIQAGIDAAVEGDTVLVADGTYTGDGNRDLDFGGVNMVVMSENGPEVTIIDCEGDSLDPHRGFSFHSGEDSSSVVQGFTIMNAYQPEGSLGAGVYCAGSSPTVAGNIITGNTCLDDGGGIGCLSSSPTIVGNTITENSGYGGGGIYCLSSSPTIMGNTITGNMAPYAGSGICCAVGSSPAIEGNAIGGNTGSAAGGGIACYYGSSPTIEGNTIVGNESDHGGGIGLLYSASPTIKGNTITGNTADLTGGGIDCAYSGFSTIDGNTITGNTAGLAGGGIRCWESSPMIADNVITGNFADQSGGGIHCEYSSSPTIEGNTITENSASLYGGGIHNTGYCSPTIINSILWSDSAGTGPEISLGSFSSITVSYSGVEGGPLGVSVAPGCTLHWGEGNIDADPMFVLPGQRDYRVLWHSPCIDSGHPDSLDPDSTRSDMGAHFFDQRDEQTLYLTPDTTEVTPGGTFGITYTAINRWPWPCMFWVLSEATLPNGNPITIMGPDRYTLPADFTVQKHLTHNVPGAAPLGVYGYGSRIGVPPSTLYDEDSFAFWVVEP